jgi:hypothetical protein
MTKLRLIDIDDTLDERERALVEHLERGPKVEWTTPLVIPLRSSWWSQAREFVSVYRLYRKQHGRRYSARIAWSIAFLGTPF